MVMVVEVGRQAGRQAGIERLLFFGNPRAHEREG